MYPYHILIISTDSQVTAALQSLIPTEYTVDVLEIFQPEALNFAAPENPGLVILDTQMRCKLSLRQCLDALTDIPVVLVHPNLRDVAPLNALIPHLHVLGILTAPLYSQANQDALHAILETAPKHVKAYALNRNLTQLNERLNQRLQELNVIYTVGKFVAASLDTSETLARILTVALNLTQAEEGFILVHENDRLFLRASKNVQEHLVQRLNIEANDAVAWRVINSGRPVMLKRDTTIATGYLVKALLYIPLQAAGRGSIGVLAVVNRYRDDPFTESQLFTLSSMADYAAIALENSRLFKTMETEQTRMRTILEQATEAILVTDSGNRLLLWSETAAAIFKIPPGAAGKPLDQCINHPQLVNLFEEAGEAGASTHAEIDLENGHTFNAQLTAIENLGRVVVMQDITHLKELDRLKSEFVSTVSHDLRTPLTTIQGYIALLERVGPLAEVQRNFIGKAMRSLSHITDLISDLLDIGRIEAGYDLDMSPLQLKYLIREVIQAQSIEVQNAGLTFQVDCCDAPLWINGNARRLRQVLENLISNAIKYNIPGGWIHFGASQDNGHVIIYVSDGGIGIPLEEQPRIFERFYRVYTPETEHVYGTGLGLAIVKSVIEKHKGRIWVESTPGEGSTFSFILPAIPDPSTEDPTPAVTGA
ncbi:MAG: GAF domain-containing protein [Anaerolineae bacterium]|nr:GAF domain-containing protein [Anaerolineae bacterium]